MKHLFKVFQLIGCVFLMSCSDEDPIEETPQMTIDFIVRDASARTATNPVALPAINATVVVYTKKGDADNNIPSYTATTNNFGMASVTIPAQETFYYNAYKGNAKATKDGFFINGIFTSEDDINDNPAQTPPGQIGNLIYFDNNGDGMVNDLDKTNYRTFTNVVNTTNSVGVIVFISE